ncbi:class II fructose-bisphosphate aldolase [Eubacteriales bacterium OttesenSCG-928-N14]|nr:class II fructose-bisphosphate aldolase [Eubacteriales bacterium OttesenSCG-928-N14]
MLVSMADILNKAQQGNYAVPAPNVWNEDSVRTVLWAAEEKNSPIILDCSFSARSYGDKAAQVMYEQMMYTIPWSREAKVPVAINLDHGMEYSHAITAIRAGFTSVMVDRSSYPFEENVKDVKAVVDVAHAVGVSVEAELGHVGEGDNYAVDGISHLTEPDEAKRYVELTKIDCLAVAIGTAHGAYVGTPKLHFDRLEAIRKQVKIPLVLHGGSGTGDDNLYKAARSGINKVNLYTDLVTEAMTQIKSKDINNIDFDGLLKAGYAGFGDKLKHYMDLLGSTDQA